MLRRARVFEHIRQRIVAQNRRYLIAISREVFKTIGCPVSMTVAMRRLTSRGNYPTLPRVADLNHRSSLNSYPDFPPLQPAMAGILSPKSDHTESLINPATATASDLSVPSPLQRPQTEAVRTPLIVMVSLPLMNPVHSRISS